MSTVPDDCGSVKTRAQLGMRQGTFFQPSLVEESNACSTQPALGGWWSSLRGDAGGRAPAARSGTSPAARTSGGGWGESREHGGLPQAAVGPVKLDHYSGAPLFDRASSGVLPLTALDAEVAELADARVSKTREGNLMRVRFPPSAFRVRRESQA